MSIGTLYLVLLWSLDKTNGRTQDEKGSAVSTLSSLQNKQGWGILNNPVKLLTSMNFIIIVITITTTTGTAATTNLVSLGQITDYFEVLSCFPQSSQWNSGTVWCNWSMQTPSLHLRQTKQTNSVVLSPQASYSNVN